MYDRGDRVLVEGFGGKRGILRVWEARANGLVLCTEEGYVKLIRGEKAPAIGFHFDEIIERVEDEPSKQD